MQDKGTPSPAIKPGNTPLRLTSQLPVSLSPMMRPLHHQIAPSPRLYPSHADSSSGSSMTSSPVQSPQTNPSGADSPQKDAFDLPPLAYPGNGPLPQSLAFPGSMPVKIPNLLSRASPQVHAAHIPATHGTAYPVGTSIDTLRFGRKPGMINTVTSPNALVARCACGKPANHRGRATSRDRGFETGFSNLVLGPSITYGEPRQRTTRIVSGSANSPGRANALHDNAISGYNTPDPLAYADGRGAASLLSRSRSDPIPPSPKALRGSNPPVPVRAPASRRASNTLDRRPGMAPLDSTIAPGAQHLNVIAPVFAASPRRGRSRDRADHPVEEIAGALNHPPDREHPPSRSRHRRDERAERRMSSSRDRERSRARRPASPVQPIPEAHAIMPSWSRRASSTQPRPMEGVVSPSMRRGGSGGVKPSAQEGDRRQEEIRRATNELGAVWGIAAG